MIIAHQTHASHARATTKDVSAVIIILALTLQAETMITTKMIMITDHHHAVVVASHVHQTEMIMIVMMMTEDILHAVETTSHQTETMMITTMMTDHLLVVAVANRVHQTEAMITMMMTDHLLVVVVINHVHQTEMMIMMITDHLHAVVVANHVHAMKTDVSQVKMIQMIITAHHLTAMVQTVAVQGHLPAMETGVDGSVILKDTLKQAVIAMIMKITTMRILTTEDLHLQAVMVMAQDHLLMVLTREVTDLHLPVAAIAAIKEAAVKDADGSVILKAMQRQVVTVMIMRNNY